MAGLLDALRAFFTPPPGAVQPLYVDWPDGRAPIGRVVMGGMESSRSLTFEQLWRTGQENTSTGNSAGVRVDSETAMRSIVFQAGVRLLVNDIGSLPVDAFRKIDGQERKELTKPGWVQEPNPLNPNVTWEDHVKQDVYSLLTDGNAFVRCFPNRFRPEGIETLEPGKVDIDTFRGNTVYPVQGEGTLTPAEILHIPWFLAPGKSRGLNPIAAAQEGLGIALASDQFVGSYFGNGAILSGWIKFPPGTDPTPEQVDQLKKDFQRKHQGTRKSHAVGALTGGAEYMPFEYSNRDAQLLELRDQVVEEVARLLGIPPFMLGSQKPGAVGYNSVEQRAIDYVTHGILPIVRRLETAYSSLLRGQRTYLKFNLRGLLAGDQTARAAYYDSLLQNKVIKREEVRALEDFEWDGELGYLETPNNNAPEEPQEPTDAPD